MSARTFPLPQQQPSNTTSAMNNNNNHNSIAGSPVSAVRRASSTFVPQPPNAAAPSQSSAITRRPSSTSHLNNHNNSRDTDDAVDTSHETEQQQQQQHLPVVAEDSQSLFQQADSVSNFGTKSKTDSVTLQAMINKDLSKYSQEDLNQVRELYQTLIETGALSTAQQLMVDSDVFAPGGLPNAFALLGSEIPGSSPHRKSQVLKSLIRKHQLGVDYSKKTAISFMAFVSMLCVPVRDKKKKDVLTNNNNNTNNGNKTGVVRFEGGSSMMMTREQLFRMREQTDDNGNDNDDNNHDQSQNPMNNNGNIPQQGRESPSVLATLVGRETPASRTSSPDLFGDLRSSSPTTPVPGNVNLNSRDIAQDENSPERILEKLDSITNGQTERSKRAKRIIRLSRKELYAACEIQPVSAFNAGHDMGKLKRKTNARHPLLADEEAKAETARHMRQMARPRGIVPAPFHGAAARSIANMPYYQRPSALATATTSARTTTTSSPSSRQNSARRQQQQQRPPLSPRTPTIGESGRGSPRNNNHRLSTTSPFSDSSYDLDDDDDTITSDDLNNSLSRSHRRRLDESSTKFPSVKNQNASGRKNVRSGRLHVVIEEPQRYKHKQPVVQHLSARVKMREAQRAMEEQDQNDLGSYATSRTLARRLRKIEAGEKVQMFDDVESKILQRWIRD